MKQENKDLCKSCEHSWLDFPLPCEQYIPHCEVLDKKPGGGNLDEAVPYPCSKCPFNSYLEKK